MIPNFSEALPRPRSLEHLRSQWLTVPQYLASRAEPRSELEGLLETEAALGRPFIWRVDDEMRMTWLVPGGHHARTAIEKTITVPLARPWSPSITLQRIQPESIHVAISDYLRIWSGNPNGVDLSGLVPAETSSIVLTLFGEGLKAVDRPKDAYWEANGPYSGEPINFMADCRTPASGLAGADTTICFLLWPDICWDKLHRRKNIDESRRIYRDAIGVKPGARPWILDCLAYLHEQEWSLYWQPAMKITALARAAPTSQAYESRLRFTLTAPSLPLLHGTGHPSGQALLPGRVAGSPAVIPLDEEQIRDLITKIDDDLLLGDGLEHLLGLTQADRHAIDLAFPSGCSDPWLAAEHLAVMDKLGVPPGGPPSKRVPPRPWNDVVLQPLLIDPQGDLAKKAIVMATAAIAGHQGASDPGRATEMIARHLRDGLRTAMIPEQSVRGFIADVLSRAGDFGMTLHDAVIPAYSAPEFGEHCLQIYAELPRLRRRLEGPVSSWKPLFGRFRDGDIEAWCASSTLDLAIIESRLGLRFDDFDDKCIAGCHHVAVVSGPNDRHVLVHIGDDQATTTYLGPGRSRPDRDLVGWFQIALQSDELPHRSMKPTTSGLQVDPFTGKSANPSTLMAQAVLKTIANHLPGKLRQHAGVEPYQMARRMLKEINLPVDEAVPVDGEGLVLR